MQEQIIKLKAADALDEMQGLERAVAFRRFLGAYSYEQIASELGLSEVESMKIAAAGLRRIKDQVFGK